MIGCMILWLGIACLLLLYKKERIPIELGEKEWKYVFLVLVGSNLVATAMFGTQLLSNVSDTEILRNTYGEGGKSEYYEVTLEGELKNETIKVDVKEQEYTPEETREMFHEMVEKLDKVILAENESFDRVEHDLDLVSYLDEYPADISWEINRYDVIDIDGKILEDYKDKKGTLLELHGTIRYGEEVAVYTANAMVFPELKTGKEKWMADIKELLQAEEERTREEKAFVLPTSLDGRVLSWKKIQDKTGYYIAALGIVTAAIIAVKSEQDKRELEKKRKEQMLLDYPEIISTFTLLLSTGMTLKSVWQKIVRNYEENKLQTGRREAYEEMSFTYREVQSGVPEKEAYERFGQRCGIISYMKLGALLSQNLRKGSRGLTELLEMESIQAFEERKSNAKKMGEEASTKLMLPMFAMLAVVLVMVVIPAFLSMQI